MPQRAFPIGGGLEGGLRFRPLVRRTQQAGATLFLLVLGWKALSGGVRQMPRARTPGQKVETLVQIVNGLLGFLALAASIQPGRWGAPLRRAWGVTLAAAAGLSALVWGPPMPLVGALFAGLALLAARGVERALCVD